MLPRVGLAGLKAAAITRKGRGPVEAKVYYPRPAAEQPLSKAR